MTEPDPRYTATYPDARLVSKNGTMPEWFRLYLMQRRRALITEIKAIEKALDIKS